MSHLSLLCGYFLVAYFRSAVAMFNLALLVTLIRTVAMIAIMIVSILFLFGIVTAMIMVIRFSLLVTLTFTLLRVFLLLSLCYNTSLLLLLCNKCYCYCVTMGCFIAEILYFFVNDMLCQC